MTDVVAFVVTVVDGFEALTVVDTLEVITAVVPLVETAGFAVVCCVAVTSAFETEEVRGLLTVWLAVVHLIIAVYDAEDSSVVFT